MNMKSDVIVSAWLEQIAVTDCDVGIVSYTQKMAVVKKYLVSNIERLRVETNNFKNVENHLILLRCA